MITHTIIFLQHHIHLFQVSLWIMSCGQLHYIFMQVSIIVIWDQIIFQSIKLSLNNENIFTIYLSVLSPFKGLILNEIFLSIPANHHRAFLTKILSDMVGKVKGRPVQIVQLINEHTFTTVNADSI